MTVSDLAARRGEDLIFSGISFSLQAGEALIVTGRNGSGKSTLIRVIAGLLSHERGEVSISVAGVQVPRAAEACHYLGHRNAMKREMTVEENLVFWKRFMGDFSGGAGVEPEQAAVQLGLAELLHLPFGYLSAGQQRRMAMAKLLCAWRPVWLLDEPTAAVDVQSEELFAGLMWGHLARGGIIIAATHQELGLENAQRLEMKGFEYHGELAS
ncbi:heme ABC exporter ATP-binding protein CcmA [Rhizobium sp. TH2]|nr:heme ABC exporter ATP-binding protein CcmA [Rhizobium sp. TH2]UVC12070.1 heme ABC exporter ATP-binding protein CcmA [Rhizobium sp. TH2]